MEWPTVARDDEIGRALAALGDGRRRGVALVGESGVGKSTLAHAVAHAAESSGCRVEHVSGTRTGMAVPLGAFSRLAAVDLGHELPAIMAAAHAALARQANLVVVVDDAQLLDPLSAALVYQLAVEGATRLIVTLRSGVEVPDAVRALLTERWLIDVAVEPLSRDRTAELARTVLDDAVEDGVIDELYRRTMGNLLLLRGFLTSGLSSGVLARTEEGWRLSGSLQPDREMYALLEYRLQSLDPQELAVIEILAIAELVEWWILTEICDPAAVERLRRSGMVHVISDSGCTLAQLNHAVIGEAAMRRAGVVRSRELNGLLARIYRRHLADGGQRLRWPDERGEIRLAQFVMRSDLPPDPDLALRGATAALALANMAVGEELAEFAFEHGGGLPAALLLGDAMHWRGRNDDAEVVFGECDPNGGDPLLTAQWAGLRAANLFDGGRTEHARDVLADARCRIEPDPAVELIDAVEATFAFYSGDFAAAIEQGVSICRSGTHPLATAWAAASTSWALALSGRFAELDEVADAALRATTAGPSGLQRLVVGLAQAVAAASRGELSAAQAMLQGYAALSAGVPEAQAIVFAVSGYVQMLRGDLVAAAAAARSAIAGLSAGFQPAVLVLGLAWWAQVEAARGDAEAAAVVLQRADANYGPHAVAFLPELELARAWVSAVGGQTSAARRHALHAAAIARRRRADVAEMHALHVAVGFGDHAQAVRLAELARTLAAPLPEAIADRARGVAGHDGDLLDAVAGQLCTMGALALAADTAAQASREHARHDRLASERESSRRALRLAERTGLRSPAISTIARPLPITDREREVAVLVAEGLSNRAIAARLGLSVRTVDGHLYRIFGKLDVRNRNQLRQMLDGAP